jgi:cation diffusion facilitator CzcD-associated flavoprotein CzcO
MAEHLDVVIVGAGLSGIGAACHLRRECPDRSVAILEARDALGGTWDLFRYPGVRSDSDMFTLGYSFRPWKAEESIAAGPAILDYIRDTAAEYGIGKTIRFRRRVTSASWDSDSATWTVTVEHADPGSASATEVMTCDFLWICTGYYRYDQGHNPSFPGIETFQGEVVHPQHWPADLDYAGKQVVVIGSGATAVTLVPAMAGTAAHVTMLQRSPTYVIAAPGRSPIADKLKEWVPARWAPTAIRWFFAAFGVLTYQLCRRRPQLMKNLILRGTQKQLPEGFDIATHFTPAYNPWDQRMCLVPDGDLFRSLRDSSTSVVTDTIEEFTPDGIRLSSGEVLPADIVVTATGLNLLALGGMQLQVDGHDIELRDHVAYKGMMLSGVPNAIWTVGYTNASWTLKADLIARYFCRLLHHMSAQGYDSVTPQPPVDGERLPLLDLKSGYVQRSLADFPTQGGATPWRLHQNYLRDYRLLAKGPVDDEVTFGRRVSDRVGPARELVGA